MNKIDFTQNNFTLLFLGSFLGFLLGCIISGFFEGNLIKDYQGIIGAAATIAAGIVAFISIKYQIEHNEKTRELELKNARCALGISGCKIYMFCAEKSDLFATQDNLVFYRNINHLKKQLEEEFTLPPLFDNDIYISKLGFEFFNDIITFRTFFRKTRQILLEDSNLPKEKVVESLQNTLKNYRKAFKMNLLPVLTEAAFVAKLRESQGI